MSDSAVRVTPGARQPSSIVTTGRGAPAVQANTANSSTPSDRSFRRSGAGRTFDRTPGRGSAVTVTPSNRVVAPQSAGSPNVPRVAEEAQRRRGPSQFGGDHRGRPVIPAAGQNTPGTPAPQARAQVSTPTVRQYPQVQRGIHQSAPPVAATAPAQQAVSAPRAPEVRSAPPPVSTGRGQQMQADRGSRSENRGGRGRNNDR
jgi:hypothetical protein